MLRELELLLLILTLIVFTAFLVIIVLYYYYSRKRSNNYLSKKEFELRYFIQKQVDREGQLTGYECLLRQRQPDGSWALPQQLETLPLQRVIYLLESIFKLLPTEPIQLSINLEYDQIISPEFDYFVRWAISKIEPMQLAIELSIHPDTRYPNRNLFLRHIRQTKTYGMRFEVANVGNAKDNLNSIEWMVPMIDALKCAMRDFRKTDPAMWFDLNLQFWRRFTQEQNINLVLTGIESDDDAELAEHLNIDLRQGYLFGHPVDPIHSAQEKAATRRTATPKHAVD
ncbi:diguanylate cyclase phosphodiesterase domain-containing protein [Lapidilactobacillus concavus DSM 17758]|uniref:Diguanylate cyclase phosphodiesterase domain-containing protein n=1 Tax=Lapidilactobacillus concavus DSM 17758 TaxID=1423735 RepID=A0A0R1VQX0_9LACO|nr:EAL domain-containing protein [Lapidilactobacillus concavus]KRM08018.1 diguanylate cyclase phosphodiesterase domain-containing protein [Lapidilactobacillus concavus DSM 17758]GEL13982.1 diguanylate cyclase [Lapidilactobacillus concavus]